MNEGMDKKTILAVILAIGILLIWQILFPTKKVKKDEKISEIVKKPKTEQVDTPKIKEVSHESKDLTTLDTLAHFGEKIVQVEDERSVRLISNKKGVHFKEYLLKEYEAGNEFAKNEQNRVNLINDSFNNNGFNIEIKFLNGKNIFLNRSDFLLKDSILTEIRLSESNPETTLNYEANIDGKKIFQSITFYNNRFDYDITFDFSSLNSDLIENGIIFEWKNGMPYTESNAFEDENMSLVFLDGENDYYRFDTADDESENFVDSKFKHITIRSKYFMTSIIPLNFDLTKVAVNQRKYTFGEESNRRYNVTFSLTKSVSKFKFYTGPYKENELNKYEEFGIDNVFLNASGYENTFSIISKPMHSFLLLLYDLIGNFGLAIILFTIIIKLALFPLTKKSYTGMKSMSALQPRIQKLKEKHGNNTMEMQHAMRNLYQEAGVNPLSGCLPMFLQMPLLLSLFQIFRGAIELRGVSFLWIQNFAAPDAFPIGLDSIGFATINLLPILVAVSQILTSKQTTVDPNQKMMVYVMPIMMIFFFYKWNAALNFYYLFFNIFTSIQQKLIKKPENEKKASTEKAPDGFIANSRSNTNEVGKKKKQMYKKKK